LSSGKAAHVTVKERNGCAEFNGNAR